MPYHRVFSSYISFILFFFSSTISVRQLSSLPLLLHMPSIVWFLVISPRAGIFAAWKFRYVEITQRRIFGARKSSRLELSPHRIFATSILIIIISVISNVNSVLIRKKSWRIIQFIRQSWFPKTDAVASIVAWRNLRTYA